MALGHRLPDIENRTVNLLARPVEPSPPLPPPPPPTPPPPTPPKGTGQGGPTVQEGDGDEFEGGAGGRAGGSGAGGASIVRQGSHRDLDRERLREVTATLEALFGEEPTARLELTWKLLRKDNEPPGGPPEDGGA